MNLSKKVIVSLIAVVVVIGGAVVVAGNGDSNEPTAANRNIEDRSESNTTDPSKEEPAEPLLFEGVVFDDPVEIVSAKDLSNLPYNAPEGFIGLLEAGLVGEPSPSNCVNSYSITEIHVTNAAGSTRSVDADTLETSNSCGGGSGVTWFATSGTWNEISNQAALDCSRNTDLANSADCSAYLEYIEASE